MPTTSADGIRWDLTDLFSSHDDPAIEATLNDCRARAEAFEALKELETISETLSRVGSYAGLLYAADTSRPEYQDLEQKVEQRTTEVRNLLLFFELEWLKIDDAVVEKLLCDAALKSYSHYLRALRRKKKSLTKRILPGAVPLGGFFPRSPRR